MATKRGEDKGRKGAEWWYKTKEISWAGRRLTDRGLEEELIIIIIMTKKMQDS